MAKFAVLFVLAILALQNSNATVNINLPEGVTSFSAQIQEVVAKHNTEPVIEELKKEVEALLATNDKDERLCGPKAQDFISALVKHSQADVDVCVNHAEDVAQDLQDKLALLAERTNALSQLLGDHIAQCGGQHPRDVLGFAACVEENTKDLREELEQLELQMTQVSLLTLQSINEALKELDVCLAKVENKITLEGRAIVSGLNQCIKNVDMLYARNAPNKINEIIIKHNVEAVIKELKTEVEDLINLGERIERLCGPSSHNLVEALVEEAHNEANECFVQFSNDLEQFDVCLAKIENKVTLEGRAIVYNVNQCIQNVGMLYARNSPNKINEIIVKHNVEAVIMELKKEVEALLNYGQRIEHLCGPKTHDLVEALAKVAHNEVNDCFVQFSNDLEQFDICLAKIENKVTLEERAIIYNVNQCIQNVGMLYVRNAPNKINEIIVKHNVEAVVIELKKEVEALLNYGERIEHLCGPTAHDLVEALAKEAHNEANECFVQFSNDLEQFDVCLAKIENKVTLEGRAIVYKLNQCIQNVGMLYARNSPNKINEIIVKHNVEAVVMELKKEVEALLNLGERIEHLCGPAAHDLVEALTKESHNEANECFVQFSNDLEQFDVCLAKVENKVTLEGRAIVYNVNQCIQNVGMLYSRSFPDQINKVVAEHNLKSFFAQMKNEIKKLLATSEKVERLCRPKAHKMVELLEKDSQIEAQLCLSMASHGLMPMPLQVALNEVKLCLDKVEDQIVSRGKIIVEGLNQCIRNADMLY